MSLLLDTNVLSELRRGRRCNRRVRAWAKANSGKRTFISVLALGEIRKGIEILRRRSPEQSRAFEDWLERILIQYEDAVLPVTEEIVDQWGRLDAVRTLPVIDGLLAATAIACDLTVATRNTGDFPSDVRVVNPWD